MYQHEGPVLDVCWSKVRTPLNYSQSLLTEYIGWAEDILRWCRQGSSTI